MILRRVANFSRPAVRCFGVVQDIAKRTLLENAVSLTSDGSLFGRTPAVVETSSLRLNEEVDSATWKSLVVRAVPPVPSAWQRQCVQRMHILLPPTLPPSRPAPLHSHLHPLPCPILFKGLSRCDGR